MGTVYQAVDGTLGRDVAIKCLNADLGDPDLLKRFRAEAIALARLNHPNIATLFELTEHDGQLLMVMEFVRGETLDRVSQREGPMPVARAARFCAQVLDALEHAHRAGVVHRDLKPANLMLTDAGLVKVMDFGLARMAGTEHLTNDGYMVGTPAYMSPEQVLGREIDGRADIYAIGVVLYRLLTLQLPFKADSGIAMVQHQLNDPPTPVRQLRSELPAACEEILQRALAKLPSERFQTAEEFRTALARLDPGVAATGVSRISSASVAAPPAVFAAVEPTLLVPAPIAPPSDAMSPATVMLPREGPAAPPARATRKIAPAAIAAGVVLFAGVPVAGALMWRANHVAPPPAAVNNVAPAAPAPVAAPAATPAAIVTAPILPKMKSDAVTRAAAAAPAPPAEAAPAVLAPVTFGKLKLLVIDEDKSRHRDASLQLKQDGLEIVDGATTIESLSYRDVTGVYYSHSKEPRWMTPAGGSASVARAGSMFGFFRGSPDWITLRTKKKFIPLRVRDDDVRRMTAELEARTGSKVIAAK
jgi:serine/threonine-protein kinase